MGSPVQGCPNDATAKIFFLGFHRRFALVSWRWLILLKVLWFHWGSTEDWRLTDSFSKPIQNAAINIILVAPSLLFLSFLCCHHSIILWTKRSVNHIICFLAIFNSIICLVPVCEWYFIIGPGNIILFYSSLSYFNSLFISWDLFYFIRKLSRVLLFLYFILNPRLYYFIYWSCLFISIFRTNILFYFISLSGNHFIF